MPERKSSLDRCNLTNSNLNSNLNTSNTCLNSNLNSSFNSNLNSNTNTSFKSNLNSSFNSNLSNLVEAATPTNTGHTVVLHQVRSNPPSPRVEYEWTLWTVTGHCAVLCCVARSW